MNELLSVRHLSIAFTQYVKGLAQTDLKVVSDLSIDIHEHEIVAVLGSSGSGKSLLAHAIFGILPANAIVKGNIKYRGEVLTPELQEKLRGDKLSLIPQSVNYLDPLMTVQDQAIGLTENDEEKEVQIKKQREIFNKYGLDESVDKLYPFQISGGMARKVLISTALLNNPDTIIADEPTPGLDEKSVEETIETLISLKEKGVGMLIITHDINAAMKMSDRIAILYLGRVLEITDTENFSGEGEKLLHPYSRALYRALPEINFEFTGGHQPSYTNIPKGCPYQENCPNKTDVCIEKQPPLEKIGTTTIGCYHPLLPEGKEVTHHDYLEG